MKFVFLCVLVLVGSPLKGRSELEFKPSCCLASSPLPFTTFNERRFSTFVKPCWWRERQKTKQPLIHRGRQIHHHHHHISHPSHHDHHRHLCRRECVVTGEDWIRTLQPHYVPPPTQSLLSEIMMIITTKPKLAYSRQGLAEGIVGLEYSSSGYILVLCHILYFGKR